MKKKTEQKKDKKLQKVNSETSKINKELENIKKENKELKDKIDKLEKELKDKEEILKNTQLQYISLKNEFDAFTRRVKENEKLQKQELFEKIILKFLPILEDFMKSYEHLPDEFKEHKWSEGLVLINKKIDKFLKDNGIEFIETIGQNVDETKHEVIGMHPIDDENKKNKIIQEVTKGYIIKTDKNEKVLLPAKVIIGQ